MYENLVPPYIFIFPCRGFCTLGEGKIHDIVLVQSKSDGGIQANVPTVKNTACRPQLGC